jgi:hypothetical protein
MAMLSSVAVGFAGAKRSSMIKGGTRCLQRVENAALPPNTCAIGDGIVFGKADPAGDEI